MCERKYNEMGSFHSHLVHLQDVKTWFLTSIKVGFMTSIWEKIL